MLIIVKTYGTINMEIKKEDIVLTTKDYVFCDGTSEHNKNIGSGHPKIYLKINKETNKEICPYCGKVFLKHL